MVYILDTPPYDKASNLYDSSAGANAFVCFETRVVS
jgi:hypothetical protein